MKRGMKEKGVGGQKNFGWDLSKKRLPSVNCDVNVEHPYYGNYIPHLARVGPLASFLENPALLPKRPPTRSGETRSHETERRAEDSSAK